MAPMADVLRRRHFYSPVHTQTCEDTMFHQPLSAATAVRRVLLLSLFPTCCALVQASAEPGDLWEDVTEIAMAGMPTHTQTHKRGTPRNDDSPPLADPSGKCEMLDVRRSASGMAWKMRCPGNVSGSGEIRYDGRERYQGAWTMDADGRAMTMKMR